MSTPTPKDVMVYLKNITRKLITLQESINDIQKRQDEFEIIMTTGFSHVNCGIRAAGEAFQQTKTCVSAMADMQEETMENLAECSGTIQAVTWR